MVTISIAAILILLPNYLIENNAIDKTFSKTALIKKNKVGLVLGTSKKRLSGKINLFYKYRIEATVELYKAKKIDFVLVSGDNGSKYYNEPATFKKDLMQRGIPGDKIFLDYAGFRTFDSVIRAKAVFGQQQITIISQQFHNERAIYIAESKGIDAVGYNAKNVIGRGGRKVKIREYFARVKVFLDLLFDTQPRFLGKKIEIG